MDSLKKVARLKSSGVQGFSFCMQHINDVSVDVDEVDAEVDGNVGVDYTAEVQVDMEEELEVDMVLVSHRDLEGPSDDLYHLMLLRISTYRMCVPHTHSFFAFQIK